MKAAADEVSASLRPRPHVPTGTVPPGISGHPGFRKSNARNSNLTFAIALKFGDIEEK